MFGAAGTIVALLAFEPFIPAIVSLGLLVCSFAAYLWMLTAEARRPRLRLRRVVGATVLVLGVAVVVPPRESNDIWSYAMYGRIVASHHASPYRNRPSDYTKDPVYKWVIPIWRHRGSVYGPVFTAVSAAAAPIGGTSRLRIRLTYEVLAALAVAAALALVWQRTRSPVAVAWLGLQPAVALQIVNAGKNDALVGLAVLGAVLLAQRRRWRGAGLTAGLGAAIKLPGVLAGAGLALWIWRRHGRNRAVQFASRMAIVVAAAYLLAGGTAALMPVRAAGRQMTNASAWALVPRFGLGVPGTALILAVVATLILIVLLRHTNASAAAAAIGGPAAFVLAGPYVLPAYSAWVLPAAALEDRALSARILTLHAGLLVIMYQLFRHPLGLPSAAMLTAETAVGLASVVLLVAYVVVGRSRSNTLTGRVGAAIPSQ